ncbi:hypothetical protein [uncultured Lutibacter sp.]|uniref:hypothetical protein n=1 Tax=uncultured Lutibacter sp. TaxID=437739 RepID=UPI00261D70E7|nr:hypothetical protein [uncultured Lutibacter sp.]
MSNNKQIQADFCIEIDFTKDSENPARIFQTMTDLITSFQDFDSNIIKGIDAKLEPVILLEDIEKGSLRTWLSSKLKGVPDEAIKSGDWKQLVGNYLVKAKYIIINKLDGVTQITDGDLIEDIQYELVEEAKKTDIKLFPHYQPMPLPKLVSSIDKINKALKHLDKKDTAIIKSDFGNASFNLELEFSAEDIEDFLTKEKIENKSIMILKVKKPDYLGSSMWEFRFSGKIVPAKITHESWLIKFQQRKVDIRPGDSIKAKVNTIVKYGHDNNVINQTYEITEVLDVLPLTDLTQFELDV